MSASEDLAKDKFLSMLENAGKVRFFLLIMSFFLLFDSMMVYFSGVGIVGMQAKEFKVELALGIKLLIAFVVFSGLLSLVFSILYHPAMLVYQLVVEWFRSIGTSLEKAVGQHQEARPYLRQYRQSDYVRPWELRLEAHETESEFLLSLYNDHVRVQEATGSELRTLQFYAFCALVLAIVNFCVSSGLPGMTVTGWIEVQWSNTVVLFGLGVFFVLMVAPLHIELMSNEWIYCPPLHRKLEKTDKDRHEYEEGIKEEIKRDVAIRRALRDQDREHNPENCRE